VVIAAVISLVGTVVSVAALFLRTTTAVVTVTTSGTVTSISVSLATVYDLGATAGIGLVLAIVYVGFWRRAFRTLSPVDARFATPAKLTLLELLALVLLAPVGAAILVLLYDAIHCAGIGNPITSACLSFGAIAGLTLLLVVFAILAVVGFIGFLLGVWRLGTRYRESMFKVAAILLIIPLLNIIGVILVLVAARSARARIEGAGGPAMPSFG
jgi:hypothetical protein